MITHSKPYITTEDINAVSEQLHSGQLARGSKVKEFEIAVKNYLGFAYTKFMDSGSHALKIALEALGVGNNDEVILPTYVCHNVIEAVFAVKAKPLLCDIGDGWNMNTGSIEKVFTPRTKVIIAVHTMGMPMDIASLKKFNIPIIEDCCQAFGLRSSQKNYTGKNSDLSVFSFHAIKCLTTGEGGMVATNNALYAERIMSICKNKSEAGIVSDLQAALGLSQLIKYPAMLEKRKQIADFYFYNIINKRLTAKFERNRSKAVFFRFLIETEIPFEMIRMYFENNGIAVRKGVDELLHQTYPDYALHDYHNAESAFEKTVSLPIYPSLEMKDIEKIVTTLNSYEKLR